MEGKALGIWKLKQLHIFQNRGIFFRKGGGGYFLIGFELEFHGRECMDFPGNRFGKIGIVKYFWGATYYISSVKIIRV